MNGRHVRYVGAEMRRVVWRDVEVRDALLAAEDRAVWGALVEDLRRVGAGNQVLNLLDLVAAMSLECREPQQLADARARAVAE